MTFLQLEYFHAVAESGSISRVAEQYNISPAALSRSINQLERELGAELFDHEGRSIVLNENGRIFLECASEIIDSMLVARKRISDTNQRRMVRARFDVLLDEPGELPIAFKLARPDLLVEIIPPYRVNSRFDIRIFATSSLIDDPRYELLCTERFVAAFPADHPLAHEESVRLSDLKGESFNLYKQDHHEETVFTMCAEAGFAPRIAMAFGLAAHRGLYNAICKGIGCSIVPERVCKAEWDLDRVSLVPFSDIQRIRHIYATSYDGSPLNDDCRFVVDTIKNRLVQSE